MKTTYAHIFRGSKPGTFDLYITETPNMVNARVHSVHGSHPEARRTAREANAKPWNYVDANPKEKVAA